MTHLEIFLYDRWIGTITHLPGDRNLFTFEQSYIDDPQRPMLSLSFKDVFGNLILDIPSTQTRLPSFFSNLLPEGVVRDYLAKHAGVSPKREFFLLAALGKDLPGAIRVGFPIRFADEKFEPILTNTEQEGALRFSLAGVQMKFSANWEKLGRLTIPAQGIGGDWIVKLPSFNYSGVPQNEFTMMELARRIGIDVPETGLVPLKNIEGLPQDIGTKEEDAFVIKRFDREPGGKRIHIEDFTQVFGVFPEKKYSKASYRNIAQVIWREIGEKGLEEFVRRFVFNALIGNGDMHLKNWSLIYPDQQKAQLAPAYDFVSTLPYLPNDNLALNFIDSKSFNNLTLDQFRRFAEKVKAPQKLVLQTVDETVERFFTAWQNREGLPLDLHVEAAITHHLKMLPFIRNINRL